MQATNYAISDYDYDLPAEKIANYPLLERDASKLLIYQNLQITESTYHNIANYIPTYSLMVFNNTKVIQARILFTKSTGSTVEIFVLEAYQQEIATAMQQTESIVVACYIGNAVKFKPGTTLHKYCIVDNVTISLHATLIEKNNDYYIVQLQWHSNHTFAQVLATAGNMPLPPYIKRQAESSDTNRYQTIYAEHNGSVAAPTAGLHFTPYIQQQLLQQSIVQCYVTLHVGAGTFKPVTTTNIEQHVMHHEYINVSLKSIEQLLQYPFITGVGTTSIRTMETIYWLGVLVSVTPTTTVENLHLTQWQCYSLPQHYTKTEALTTLLYYMQLHRLSHISTHTQLMITPAYKYRVANAVITNFHQPKSTLLLLVAAATNGAWRKLYEYAHNNEFRFLSYGDGSLIFIQQ